MAGFLRQGNGIYRGIQGPGVSEQWGGVLSDERGDSDEGDEAGKAGWDLVAVGLECHTS